MRDPRLRNLSRIEKVTMGGVVHRGSKERAELFGGVYGLDRFDLKGALYQGLGSGSVVGEIYQACVRGEVSNVERLLTKAQLEADRERAKEVMRLRLPYGYLIWREGLPS